MAHTDTWDEWIAKLASSQNGQKAPVLGAVLQELEKAFDQTPKEENGHA